MRTDGRLTTISKERWQLGRPAPQENAMAQKQEIEITISPSGEVQLKVIGMAGKGCLEATKDLEDALGVVVAREKTSEFYQNENNASINIGNGTGGQA
jgi:hypothetical protein